MKFESAINCLRLLSLYYSPESIRGTSTPVWESESPTLLPSTLLVKPRDVKAQFEMTCSRLSICSSSNEVFPVEISALTDKGEFWQVNDGDLHPTFQLSAQSNQGWNPSGECFLEISATVNSAVF